MMVLATRPMKERCDVRSVPVGSRLHLNKLAPRWTHHNPDNKNGERVDRMGVSRTFYAVKVTGRGVHCYTVLPVTGRKIFYFAKWKEVEHVLSATVRGYDQQRPAAYS
jgi:hypothetical protein